MGNNRRSFLKLSGLTGLTILGGGIVEGATKMFNRGKKEEISFRSSGKKRFNMSGYAAPKLETVGVGIIGLHRGRAHLRSASKIDKVNIRGISDLLPENIEASKKILEGTNQNPEIYTGDPEAWKKLCERKDIDFIYIDTPWDLHVPMALYAMEQGKHVGIEVPAATTLGDCWKLVITSEKTRKHC